MNIWSHCSQEQCQHFLLSNLFSICKSTCVSARAAGASSSADLWRKRPNRLCHWCFCLARLGLQAPLLVDFLPATLMNFPKETPTAPSPVSTGFFGRLWVAKAFFTFQLRIFFFFSRAQNVKPGTASLCIQITVIKWGQRENSTATIYLSSRAVVTEDS